MKKFLAKNQTHVDKHAWILAKTYNTGFYFNSENSRAFGPQIKAPFLICKIVFLDSNSSSYKTLTQSTSLKIKLRNIWFLSHKNIIYKLSGTQKKICWQMKKHLFSHKSSIKLKIELLMKRFCSFLSNFSNWATVLLGVIHQRNAKKIKSWEQGQEHEDWQQTKI